MKNFLKNLIIGILQFEARLVLEKYKPKVIAVTGSVGKTSTKEAIYAVLSKQTFVRKSEGRFDSSIGLPLCILGQGSGGNNPLLWLGNIFKGMTLLLIRRAYPKWLILEVAVRKPKDMDKIVYWLKSDIVVVTRIGSVPSHVEFFKSVGDLVLEKGKLIKTLKKDGVLILNADDSHALSLKNTSKNKVITFGFNEEANLVASNSQILYGEDSELDYSELGQAPKGIVFRVDSEGSSLPIMIEGAFGANHIYAGLAALAVSRVMGFNMVPAAQALRNYDLPPGRMRIIRGIKGTIIIDDSYNSSPLACESALKILEEIKVSGPSTELGASKKIAVLGDMLELGEHTDQAHKEIGKLVAKTADILVAVGVRAVNFAEGAMNHGMSEEKIYEFEDSRKAGKFLESIIKKGDIILIKGSQAVNMERAVEEIMANPELKTDLLVRQDERARIELSGRSPE